MNIKRKHIFKVEDKVKLTDKETNETEIITIDEIGFDDPYNGCDYFIERKDGYEWIYYIESRKKKRCFWYLYEERKYYKFEKMNDRTEKCMLDKHGLKVGDKIVLTPKPESFNLGYKEIEGTIKDIYVDTYDNTKNCFDVCDDFKDCQYTFVFNDLKGHECYQETGVCGDTKVEYTFKKISKIKEMKDNVKNLVDNALEVLQAYKDGKEIEVKGKENDKWTIFDNRAHTFFDFERCDYRIKEEEEYRPYRNAEEFNFDRDIKGVYIVPKQNKYRLFPVYFDDKLVLCYKMLNDTTPMKEIISYENLFKHYTWDNGTPCGWYFKNEQIDEGNRKQ